MRNEKIRKFKNRHQTVTSEKTAFLSRCISITYGGGGGN